MKKIINLLDWGLIEYNLAWEQQEELFNNTIQKKNTGEQTGNFLIFCEHPHVYTLGKSGDEHNMLLNYIQLQAKNAQLIKTNRGGDITYHGPGQLVGYPIFDLANFNIGLKQYIFLIEESIIQLLSLYNIKATRLNGATGVWLEVDTPRCRKICAIGVRASHYVTMHGFALNINTDLNYFNFINPCGFIDKGVTSLQNELGYELSLIDVKNNLFNVFNKLFEIL